MLMVSLVNCDGTIRAILHNNHLLLFVFLRSAYKGPNGISCKRTNNTVESNQLCITGASREDPLFDKSLFQTVPLEENNEKCGFFRVGPSLRMILNYVGHDNVSHKFFKNIMIFRFIL